MKLKLLAAASALAIAGVSYGVYRETQPDTGTAAAGIATPATPVERATPSSASLRDEPATAKPSPATAAASPLPSGARMTRPAAPALPASAGAAANHDVTATGSREQPAGSAGSASPTLRGLSSIKPRPRVQVDPAADESPVARTRRMNATIESAACHAPDLEQRYRRLPENDRAALRTKCAKYGVTLADPS